MIDPATRLELERLAEAFEMQARTLDGPGPGAAGI